MMHVISALVSLLGAGCPTREAVISHLAELPTLANAPTWQIGTEADHVRIDLSQGGIVTTRQLPLQAGESCDDRALAVATIIAAWSQPLEIRSVDPKWQRRGNALRFDVAASFVNSLALSSAWAPGADVSFSLGRERWLFHLDLVAFGRRAIDVDPVAANYLRAWMALGPVVRFRPWRLVIDLRAQLLFGLTQVEGSRTAQTLEADAGLGAGVRLALRAGPVAPFLGFSLAGWLRSFDAWVQHSVPAGSASQRLEIPKLEGLFSAGVAVGSP
jgi:hypothetical protein